MGVNGIGGYGETYRSYRIENAPWQGRIPAEEVSKPQAGGIREAEKPETAGSQENGNGYGQEIREIVSPDKPGVPEDFSLTFNKNESFDYIGSESELESLDVQKALSDMRRDQILEEYQYFVGSSRNLPGIDGQGEGTVVRK